MSTERAEAAEAKASADWDAMWQLASAAVDVVWQQNTGPTMPSTRDCVQAAVRALWEAGYRRYGATPSQDELGAAEEARQPAQPISVADFEQNLLQEPITEESKGAWRDFLKDSVKIFGEDALPPYSVQVLSHPPEAPWYRCQSQLKSGERILYWKPAGVQFVSRPDPQNPQHKPKRAYGFLEPVAIPICPECMVEYMIHGQFLVIPDEEEIRVIFSDGSEL